MVCTHATHNCEYSYPLSAFTMCPPMRTERKMRRLPVDIICMVFRFADALALDALSAVDRSWRKAASRSSCWTCYGDMSWLPDGRELSQHLFRMRIARLPYVTELRLPTEPRRPRWQWTTSLIPENATDRCLLELAPPVVAALRRLECTFPGRRTSMLGFSNLTQLDTLVGYGRGVGSSISAIVPLLPALADLRLRVDERLQGLAVGVQPGDLRSGRSECLRRLFIDFCSLLPEWQLDEEALKAVREGAVASGNHLLAFGVRNGSGEPFYRPRFAARANRGKKRNRRDQALSFLDALPTSLTELSLHHCHLATPDVRRLLSLVEDRHRPLRRLDLRCNPSLASSVACDRLSRLQLCVMCPAAFHGGLCGDCFAGVPQRSLWSC